MISTVPATSRHIKGVTNFKGMEEKNQRTTLKLKGMAIWFLCGWELLHDFYAINNFLGHGRKKLISL